MEKYFNQYRKKATKYLKSVMKNELIALENYLTYF